jgi:hypothetical protein
VPFALAAVYLVMALVGAMLIGFVYTTTTINYQAGHATGKALAVLSAVMAAFGMLGMSLLLISKKTALSPNLRLLIEVAILFAAFDIGAGALILAT